MAETIVDALLVTLGIDSSEYRQGMEEADRATKNFSEKAPRQAEQGLNKIEQKFGMTFQGIFRSFIAPLTAALGTMGVFSQYTQTADRIGKTAARIGASAEDLQVFGEAAKRAGGSVEGFMSSFEGLNGQLQRMQAMGGKGRIAPILKQLGISATENGKVKDTFQLLRELSGAAEKMGAQKFAGLARFLGLDQGTIMLLQQGRVALDEVIARQRALGVYTKEDFEVTAKFNDSIADLQQSFRAMAAPILRVITPALKTIADWLTAIVQTFRKHQGFIVAGLTVIAATMSGVLLKAAIALGTALSPLLAPIAAIAGLGLIFDEIATYANGGETALKGLWEAMGTPEEYLAVGSAIKNGLLKAWDETKAALAVVGSYLVKVGEALSPLADIVTPLVDAFKSLLSTAWELLAWGGEFAAKIAAMLLPLDEVFSPGEPGSGWDALKKIAEVVSLAFQSLSYVIKEASDWIGDMTQAARRALSSLDFLEPLKKMAGEIAAFFGDMFAPGQPGGEWGVLRSIVDGIKDAIDLMIGSIKTLFSWVEKVVNGVRVWLGGGEIAAAQQAASKNALTGGKSEDEYIAEQAAALQKKQPGLSQNEAAVAVKKQLDYDAKLLSDYKTFGGDRLSLESIGYNGIEIDELEKMLKNAPPIANTAALPPNMATTKADIAQAAGPVSMRNEQTINNETRIDTINVNTQATDAQGVANALPGAIQQAAPNITTAGNGGNFQ